VSYFVYPGFREMDSELAGRMLPGFVGEIFQQQLIGQHQEVKNIIKEIHGVSADKAAIAL
jgi:hypothetical protein